MLEICSNLNTHTNLGRANRIVDRSKGEYLATSPAATRTRSLFLVAVVAAAVAVAVHPVDTTSAGGEYSWYPIGDIDSPHVQELGGWAVSEHVKRANDGLRFGKVVSGEEQDVGGVKYHLVVDALSRDGKHGRYVTELIEDVSGSTRRRRLISFVPAN